MTSQRSETPRVVRPLRETSSGASSAAVGGATCLTRSIRDRVTAPLGAYARAVNRQMSPLFSVRGVRGAAIEALWGSAHLSIYPLGLLRERHHESDERYRPDDLAPHQRGLVIGDVEAAGTPILLIHGMVDNRIIFTALRHRLRRRGFGRVFTINYSPLTNDVRAAAMDLSRAIEELVARTDYERIHVIGHSMGGLIARYYVQRLGGDQRVHTLVTLASPHAGSVFAYGLPVQLGRQLRPGSDLFAELAEPAPECRTRFVAYYSDTDQVVVPHESGRIEHPDLAAENVPLQGVGHMTVPIHPTVIEQIGNLLSQLDSHGGTLRTHYQDIDDQDSPDDVLPARRAAGSRRPRTARSAGLSLAQASLAQAQSLVTGA